MTEASRYRAVAGTWVRLLPARPRRMCAPEVPARLVRLTGAVGLLAVALATTACSWQTGYLTGQQWQRNACNRIPDQLERDRCLGSTDMSYVEYRRRTEGTGNGKVPSPGAP